MENKVVFGNSKTDGANRWGWFIGHFITPDTDPRSTSDLEIKWGTHKAGEGRSEWAMNAEATTLSILISGRFQIQFPDREVVLSNEGDYVLWCPGVPHTWLAQEDSTILSVRWPSKSGDSVGMGSR